jgi:hypothetical protein
VADSVNITLSSHYDGKAPGDKIDVDVYEAKRLVDGGIAVPSTVPAAKKAGVDEGTAATKRD